MSGYASFIHGGSLFPLNHESENSLLEDSDPVLFHLLDFYAAVLKTYLEARLLVEAELVGAPIKAVVAEKFPMDPEPFLAERHTRFPLLAAYRVSSQFTEIGSAKHSESEFDICYVLPPLKASEAERIVPILKAVASVIDDRTEQGFDPDYTPKGASKGASVWGLAGVAIIEITSITYGTFKPTDKLFFPTVILKLKVAEKSANNQTAFEYATGFGAHLDLAAPGQETYPDIAVIDAVIETPDGEGGGEDGEGVGEEP